MYQCSALVLLHRVCLISSYPVHIIRVSIPFSREIDAAREMLACSRPNLRHFLTVSHADTSIDAELLLRKKKLSICIATSLRVYKARLRLNEQNRTSGNV